MARSAMPTSNWNGLTSHPMRAAATWERRHDRCLPIVRRRRWAAAVSSLKADQLKNHGALIPHRPPQGRKARRADFGSGNLKAQRSSTAPRFSTWEDQPLALSEAEDKLPGFKEFYRSYKRAQARKAHDDAKEGSWELAGGLAGALVTGTQAPLVRAFDALQVEVA
jgi:hypothetical protein